MPSSGSTTSTQKPLTVVLLGRFARCSKQMLRDVLHAAEVQVEREISPNTDCVVIGNKTWSSSSEQEPTPRNLLVAQLLKQHRHELQLLSESQFYQQYRPLIPELLQCQQAVSAASKRDAGVARAEQGADNSRSLSQASAESGELQPASFLRWKQAETIAQGLSTGVSSRQMQRELKQLELWSPKVRQHWEQYAPRWNGRRLLLRTDQGQLAEASGQLLIEAAFVSPETPAGDVCATIPFPQPASASTTAAPKAYPTFEQAAALEQQGELLAAEHAYRQLLCHEGPDFEICFNLANVLSGLNRLEAAMERLWQCVELAPQFTEAWYNLGVLALELKEPRTAELAFTTTLELNPNFSAATHGLQLAQQQLIP